MKDIRTISQTFDRFNRERLIFVQSVAELSRQDSNVAPLTQADAPQLLSILLQDSTSPAIQCSAAIAIGRMAQTSPTASEIFFANDIIPLLLKLLLNNNNDNNKSPKEKKTLLRRALWIALRNFAKQGDHFVDSVITGGGMKAAVNCIKGDNIEVKDGAIWLAECLIALGEDHTRQFLELGGVAPLITCLNKSTTSTSDPALCRAAVATLGCIARQGSASSEALASDGKVLDALRNLLVSAATAASTIIVATDYTIIGRNSALSSSASGNTYHHYVSQDDRLIRQTVLAIGDIARSGPHLADIIISKGILESIVKLLSISTSQKGDNNRRDDLLLRRHCAALLRDTARHGLPQATAVAHCSPGVLHQLIASCISGLTGNDLLPGIIAVGFVGAHASLAPLVADAGAIPALASVLMRESLDHVLSATVWALGQIGRQSHSLAAAVAITGALAIMADLECSSSVPISTTITTSNSSSSPTKAGREDLNKKCEEALSKIVKQLNELPPLEVLLQRPLTKCTAEAILQRVAEILASQPTTKAAFVQLGGLKIVQTISEATDSSFKEHISAITSQFPKEICNYFSPAYNASLLQLVASSAAADKTVSNKMVVESEEVFINSPDANITPGDEIALPKEEEEEEKVEPETDSSPPPVTAGVADLETGETEVEVVDVIEEEGEKVDPSVETSIDDSSLDPNQPGEEVQQADDIEDVIVAIDSTIPQDIGNEEEEDMTPTSVVKSIATVFTQNEDEIEDRGIDDDGIVDCSAVEEEGVVDPAAATDFEGGEEDTTCV